MTGFQSALNQKRQSETDALWTGQEADVFPIDWRIVVSSPLMGNCRSDQKREERLVYYRMRSGAHQLKTNSESWVLHQKRNSLNFFLFHQGRVEQFPFRRTDTKQVRVRANHDQVRTTVSEVSKDFFLQPRRGKAPLHCQAPDHCKDLIPMGVWMPNKRRISPPMCGAQS